MREKSITLKVPVVVKIKYDGSSAEKKWVIHEITGLIGSGILGSYTIDVLPPTKKSVRAAWRESNREEE